MLAHEVVAGFAYFALFLFIVRFRAWERPIENANASALLPAPGFDRMLHLLHQSSFFGDPVKLLLPALFVVCLAAVVSTSAAPSSKTSQSVLVKRGAYLVKDVAGCGDCHSPRDEKGQFIQDKWMQGTPLFFKPSVPMPVWADKSPNIAGLPGWTDEQAIRFLMTGLAYNDLPARPPMPQYRMNRQDAAAVVAYLRSLKPAPVAAKR